MLESNKLLKLIIKDLKERKIVVVRSLPGVGLNTFVKHISENYLSANSDFVVNYFPHEDPQHIEKLLLEKLEKENNIPHEFLSSTVSLQHYLKISGKGILVVFNKLDFFTKPEVFLDYFDSFYRSSSKRLSLLISGNLEIFNIIPLEAFERRFSQYIFNGFYEDFDNLLKMLCTQLEIKYLPQKISETIHKYSSGNLGIILALLSVYKSGNNTLEISSLLKDVQIEKRLIQILQSLSSTGINFIDLVGKKDFYQLEQLGLARDEKVNPLLLTYVSENPTLPVSIYDALSSSESSILKIFEEHKDEYMDIDKILYLLGGNAFEKSSNWAIYKHINNIKKKISSFNITIENKRGKGYRLV